MANFLSLYVTNATPHLGGVKLIGLTNFVSALATGTAAIKIHCGLSDDITLATSAGGAVKVLDAITAAVSAVPGGTVVAVDLPKGVTVTSFTMA